MSLKGKLRLFRPKTDLAKYVEHDLAKNLREIETEIAKAEANALAQATALNWDISESSGTFSTSSTTYIDITNLNVQVTTTGRPVTLGMTPDDSAGASTISHSSGTYDVRIYRNGAVIVEFNGVQAGGLPPSCFTYVDEPPAGTYTYKVMMRSGGGGASTLNVTRVKFFAREW